MAMTESIVAEDIIRIPARIHTVKEARQLLEDLSSAYQSLTAEDRREVKAFMSELWESQRRFGSVAKRHDGIAYAALYRFL